MDDDTHASIEFFDVKPIGAKEADKLALKYFTKQGIEYLFDSYKEKQLKKMIWFRQYFAMKIDSIKLVH